MTPNYVIQKKHPWTVSNSREFYGIRNSAQDLVVKKLKLRNVLQDSTGKTNSAYYVIDYLMLSKISARISDLNLALLNSKRVPS